MFYMLYIHTIRRVLFNILLIFCFQLIDHAVMFNQDKTPVAINPVWDATNQTRFVEDIKVAEGNRL